MTTKKASKTYSSPILKGIRDSISPIELAKTKKRMAIAARIDDILKQKGWKKKELADKLGKRPSEITKWLSGTHNFTTDILTEIEIVTGESIISVQKIKQVEYV